ncbi:MAG: NUDIX domain-containing protein [Oscillospiraceae bacterium]|nr:NUDIX domain-containing protein [Oscillospiraceae bacterium]
MELWDLYDENRNPTGREHIRGNEIPDGCYHLVVHVWIRNSKGQYLISQRSANRPTFPLMWETVGGSVQKGETSLQGAIREVQEEVGIDIIGTENNLVFSQVRKQINGKKFNDILDVWLFEYNGEVKLDNATTDEVAQTKWLTVAEIKELYESKQLVSTLGYFFEKIGGQYE